MNMTSFTQLLMLLAIPIFLSGMPVNRKGLITGLFVSLYFLGRFNPLLSLVPFGCAIYLFLLTKRSLISRKPPTRFKNPALPMFMVFLLTMGIFCAFGESITGYGQILNLPAAILDSGKSAVNLALSLIHIYTFLDSYNTFLFPLPAPAVSAQDCRNYPPLLLGSVFHGVRCSNSEA